MAENEDGQERSESPSARRLAQARAEGRVPRSVELSAAAVLLGGAVLLGNAGGGSLGNFSVRILRETAGSLGSGPLTTVGAVTLLRGVVLGMLVALAPFLAGVTAVALFINLLQTRGNITTGALSPRWGALNPVGGVKKLFNPESLMSLLRSVVKLILLSTVTWIVLRRGWPELTALAQTGPATILVVLRALGLRLAILTGIAFFLVGGADYAWQLFRHEKSLRMTKEEVRQENKDLEGNPQIKARIRSMQRQRARARMLQAVTKADVVITNPTHVAVALRYDPDEAPAPIVVAMGERKLAERIKSIARQAGVPLVENKPIARALLATCVVGRAIPPVLYAAVAEILAFVYRLRNPVYGRAGETRARS